mgnify:CR=1 FL=1
MKKPTNSTFTIKEALQKLEHFCAYQERCHDEVVDKLYSLKMTRDEIDTIVVQLIEGNFLNETRFACSFARGKHRIKNWGKISRCITCKGKFVGGGERQLSSIMM